MTLFNPAISRKIAQVLFILNAGIWGILGFVSLLRIPQSFPNMGLTGWIIAILMFGNAAAMLWSGIILGKHKKWLDVLALIILLVNIVLTFTDEFGALDLITLVIDLELLIFMLISWKSNSPPS
jgi:hypothetical protein